MVLSPDQKKRYARQLVLPKMGVEGQELLCDSRVLVIGAGGLGCPVALYLAAAGVGHIGVIDPDHVELSNLNRQILFTPQHRTQNKSEVARMQLEAFNPHVQVRAYSEALTSSNATDIIGAYDLIADTSDNFTTRFVVNAACVALKKTLVWGAVEGYEGQVSTVKPHANSTYPCFNCFCPELPADPGLPGCTVNGILGSIAGVVASLQATEIIKEILHIGQSLAGYILIYHGLFATVRKTILTRRPACGVCNPDRGGLHATL